MSLIDRILKNGVWESSDFAFEQLSGTSFSFGGYSGGAIPDIYTLTLSDIAGFVGTVTIAASPTNPYNGRVVTGVNFNSATAHYDIVPGLEIGWNANQAANGHSVKLFAGQMLGSYDGSGFATATPSEGVRHQVTNDGVAMFGCRAQLTEQAIVIAKIGNPLVVWDFATGAVERKVAGQVNPYVVKIANLVTGPPATCDLLVDDVALDSLSVQDQQTGVISSSEGLRAEDSYLYKIISGLLTGVSFNIKGTAASDDEANVMIFPSRYVQIAPDAAGVAGDYGTSNVTLTGANGAAGTMLGGETAYFWSRVLVPANSLGNSNPYPANIAIRGSYEGPAPW